MRRLESKDARENVIQLLKISRRYPATAHWHFHPRHQSVTMGLTEGILELK